MNTKLITTKLILSVLASCNLLDKYSVAAENTENNGFQTGFWKPVNRRYYSISEHTQNDTTHGRYFVAAGNNRFQNGLLNPFNRQEYSISEHTKNGSTTEIEEIKAEKVNVLPTDIFGDYSNYTSIKSQSDINKDTFSKPLVIEEEMTTTRLYSLCYQYQEYTFVYAGNLKLPRCIGNQLKVFTDTYFKESDIKLDQKTMEDVFVEASLIL